MISEKSQNKVSIDEFQKMAFYFGIAIQPIIENVEPTKKVTPKYMDIEVFFLSGTYNLYTSRLAEGFLCWLLQYGHLLSPAKIRRLIQAGSAYNSSVLGGFVEFMSMQNIMFSQWKIIRPFCKKKLKLENLLDGPSVRNPAPYFAKYKILAPQFKLERSKFLRTTAILFKNCLELKNRALFGSVVNSDVASCLAKHPELTAYQVSKITHHHKARVFDVYPDVRDAS